MNCSFKARVTLLNLSRSHPCLLPFLCSVPIEPRSLGATNTPALNLEEQTGTAVCPFYNILSYLLPPIGCFIHPPVKAEGADSTGSKFQGRFGDLWSNLYTSSLKCTLPTPHKTIRVRGTAPARGYYTNTLSHSPHTERAGTGGVRFVHGEVRHLIISDCIQESTACTQTTH